MPGKLKVFIVDDSFIVRERLSGLLSSLDEVEMIGEAQNAHDATTAIHQLQPDAVILDIHMPGDTGTDALSGITVLEAIKRDTPAPFVVMLSN